MNGTRLGAYAGSQPIQQPPLPFESQKVDQPESNAARAARYEDEKRRIIDSCFNKKEADGILLESYITHVRIQEDAAYPSTPPPPESQPNNKKPRLILIAVRKSGRVRVHKARENASGTFSIGKTWALDELSHIHMFAASIPSNDQERLEKMWAGDTGFTVTLGKPYYWSASTAKEKDFFIASLIKIYRKYTGGQVPELTGFSPHQIEQLTGGQIARPGAVSTPQPPFLQSPIPQPLNTPSVPSISDQRSYSPMTQRPSQTASPNLNYSQLSQPSQPRADPYSYTRESPVAARQESSQFSPPPPISEPVRSPNRVNRQPPSRENIYADPEPSSTTTTQLSKETISALPQPSQQQKPPAKTSFYQAALSALQDPPAQSQNKFTNGSTTDSRAPPSLPPTNSNENLRVALARNRTPSSSQLSDRPLTASSDATSVSTRPTTAQEPLPTRLRPPVNSLEPNGDKQALQSENNSRFTTPLATPGLDQSERPVIHTPSQNISIQKQQQQQQEQQLSPPKKDYFDKVGSETPERLQSTQPTISGPPMETPTVISASTPIPSDHAVPQSDPIIPASPPKTEDNVRPGLESAMRKKSTQEIAARFRKAATAANAFKPREGGGAARLRAMQEENKRGGEPDGITGVVPAPLLRGISTDSVSASRPLTPMTPSFAAQVDGPVTPLPVAPPKVHLERTATDVSVASVQSQPSIESKELLSSSTDVEIRSEASQVQRPRTPERQRSRSPQRRKRQRQEADVAKYCSSLNIDITLLQGRGADFNDLLTEFGWDGRLGNKKRVDDLEADVRREIGRAQATGWLGHIEQQESKVQELSKAFDKAIEECEELDGLFTLYSHELDTLQADIEYIEAQSQGLQVQTANQKLLYNELQNLLQTLTISQSDLRDLRSNSFDNGRGIMGIEQALVKLYRALTTIDPHMNTNKTKQGRGNAGVYADEEVGQMRAVREKKKLYNDESVVFVDRFSRYMAEMFGAVSRADQPQARAGSSVSLVQSQQSRRQELWLYNAMMLFVREVNQKTWRMMISNYDNTVKQAQQGQFASTIEASKKEARLPTGEEKEILFTYQEKEKHDNSLTSTAARKMTVKRGKTTRTVTMKHALGERREGKAEVWEVFQNVLQQQAQTVAEEQNFLVSFFHMSSQNNTDFLEMVSARAPEERRLPNLSAKQSYEPDRKLAAQVADSMSLMYSTWNSDLREMAKWVVGRDELQAVGMLYALETVLSSYDDTNQEFVTKTVRDIHEDTVKSFQKFIEGQVRAIEETKVKVKKRKGIIAFMRTFPLFSVAIESMVPSERAGPEALDVRYIVDDAYNKILKAMWESLTFIAKEDPQSGTVHTTVAAGGDPEDKQLLNHHILLIENMNHYLEEVETHSNTVLEEWKERANHDMLAHLTQYTDAVIRRPLGKWLDFVESTEAMLRTYQDSPQSIGGKPSHSRSACKKILKSYDASEVKRGVDVLKKRIDKHFSDIDDPMGGGVASRGLIARVNDECYNRYVRAQERMRNIIDLVYEGSLEIDWRKEDVATMFRKGM